VIELFTASDGRLRAVWRFLLAACATYLIFEISAFIAYRSGVPDRFTWALERMITAVMLLAVYLFLLKFADHASGSWSELGLDPKRAIRDLVIGIAFGAALLLVGVGAIAIIGGYHGLLQPAPHSALAIGVVTATLVFGALVEELAFRSYPFQRLVEALGAVGAIVFCSFLFGALHFANPGFSWIGLINTVLIGILFSVVFLKTGSLWLVWGMHFAWNFTLGVVLGLPVSGIRLFSVVVTGTVTGPPMLTGGEYGIEGSLTATAVILLGMVGLRYLLPVLSRTTPGTVRGIQ
jgi:uncharacterized protein